MPLEGLGVGGGGRQLCAECARGSRGGAGVGQAPREWGFVLSTRNNAGMSF